jgi:hypothetical protein
LLLASSVAAVVTIPLWVWLFYRCAGA